VKRLQAVPGSSFFENQASIKWMSKLDEKVKISDPIFLNVETPITDAIGAKWQ
jgi:hypothetical protein